MRFRWKNFTLHHYVSYVRRQSKHMQRVHAIAFAGTVTALIAGFILYTDYGFWHETYVRGSDTQVSQGTTSPSDSFGQFLQEARVRFGSIGSSGADFLEGKETYKKEGE